MAQRSLHSDMVAPVPTPAATLHASPRTSIRSAISALTGSALIGVLLGAQGILHAAHGMPDGLERTVTMRFGNTALQISQDAHLSGLWNTAQVALGRPGDSGTPPLVASISNAPPLSSPASIRPAPIHAVHAPVRVVARVKSVKTPTQPASQKSTAKASATVPSTSTEKAAEKSGQKSASEAVHKKGQRRVQHMAALPSPTKRAPLRLLITGDSLPGYMGPQILSALAPSGRVRGWTDVHDGTGLTRPDYVDWSVVASQQVKQYHPQAIVVLMGGNDFQNMVMPDGKILYAGTPAWTQEYARRAAVCMRIWMQGGGAHRVYWLSMPPARDRQWAYDDGKIDMALRLAAKAVTGVEYVNILGPITDHGKYVDYVRENGVWTLIREPDGVHLNSAGSQIVADEVVPIIRSQWHLGR
jgi:hypothetical protein